ncbi:isoleucine--tRNA ligase [Endomicrobium proavitum]|uniref:Isoleucine--tRNA ligase n=1 Tax=Endomicrobium proavitum TaxID=1408281 RepID=A0A0G3WGU5_9BACT|nr:isoleucine--tRNA ligase [Endomicrobium proavitum]AKL97543.1 isoleucyl-tRNA synthetase [Endomicrobium proavitum]
MSETEKKDFSQTVNLPKTDFQMKANLSQREPAFVENWQKEDIYSKICEKNKNNKKFIFHDGPPYANAHIHIGTGLNKVLKDFILKFRSMNGDYVPFTPGWDCHGLPIEQLALKELKTDKNKVDRMVFRKQAADFARKFVEIQKSEFKRLGVFADWNNPYLTLDPKYEASIIKVFGDLAKKGYIYRKKKPVYWCPTCETALADAEVDYADHASDSIIVKFKINSIPQTLKDKENLLSGFSVLIWTTTPWTLPANVALAFNGESDYIAAVYKLEDGREEKLIVAKALADSIKEKIKAVEYKTAAEAKGADFVNLEAQNPLVERTSRAILADFVSMEDGTGIVHIAPGHGQEDYQAGLDYGLEVLSPVNDRGLFTKEVPEFEHVHIFKANPLIIEKLEKEGKILAKLKLEHSYPHCWRCKKPIIFRATPQWFLSVEHNDLRDNLLKAIKTVNWIPKYGENRITSMIENRPDWCLSRQRLWGVPIPVFYCKDCGEALIDSEIIYHISKLFAQKGSDVWFELSEQELLAGAGAKCSSCGSQNFRKEEDILDVWFDSGVSQEAVLSSGNYKDLQFPADLYLEGSDQHRGWFQTSLIPSVAVKEKAPYKNVLTHGFVVDGEGKKMSKSLGNFISAEDMIKKYGADILRLWIASSDYREDIRISDEIIKGLSDSYRKIRNTVRFLLGNVGDFNVKTAPAYKDLQEIDKYALSRLQDLISQTAAAYESYEFHKAANAVNNFCTVFLSGFYLDALKDVLYCDKKDSAQRISAQSAMLEICSVIIRLAAPILSFTSEEAWKEISKIIKDAPNSVFLAEFPLVNEKYILPAEIILKWENILFVRQEISAANELLRKNKEIGSNLEAALKIKYGVKYANVFENKALLNLALGSWDISYEALKEQDLLEVKSSKSQYLKCARCWRHIENVKEDLCPRCAQVVK